jgi:nitroimidazol reductase NimA-like FMN-containing flavoprotein (pyridoxamine 5'-phosphate oxidase superfamily)
MDHERLASFVTVGDENEPHVVPVFFTYDNGKVYVQTDRGSLKVRNLEKNSNVAVAIYCDEEAVIIRGVGHIIDEDEGFLKKTQDHVLKYHIKLNEHGRDSLGIRLFDRKVRCVIEVTPRKTAFW